MIIKDNMANMCAKVTSTYIEFTLAFGPKPEFSFSFKSFIQVRSSVPEFFLPEYNIPNRRLQLEFVTCT